ncbi:hypothetical protein [Profundibacter sp.]
MPDKIQCTVAVDETCNVLGFQSLKLVTQGNIYEVAAGWDIMMQWAFKPIK